MKSKKCKNCKKFEISYTIHICQSVSSSPESVTQLTKSNWREEAVAKRQARLKEEEKERVETLARAEAERDAVVMLDPQHRPYEVSTKATYYR